jgi:hypothetical protein
MCVIVRKSSGKKSYLITFLVDSCALISAEQSFGRVAPVAQMDRALDFESSGRAFESRQAHRYSYG